MLVLKLSHQMKKHLYKELTSPFDREYMDPYSKKFLDHFNECIYLSYNDYISNNLLYDELDNKIKRMILDYWSAVNIIIDKEQAQLKPHNMIKNASDLEKFFEIIQFKEKRFNQLMKDKPSGLIDFYVRNILRYINGSTLNKVLLDTERQQSSHLESIDLARKTKEKVHFTVTQILKDTYNEKKQELTFGDLEKTFKHYFYRIYKNTDPEQAKEWEQYINMSNISSHEIEHLKIREEEINDYIIDK